jgi:hypothetical protein
LVGPIFRNILLLDNESLYTNLDVEEVFGEDGGTMVDGLALSVELTTKHLSGDGHLQHVTSEFAVSMRVVNFGGTLKNLEKRNDG